MLHIAICDDLADQLERIAGFTNEYITQNGLNADVQMFSHPDMLLKIAANERFHIYILDIVMPMLNGIELGVELRRFDREAQIIYTTSEPGFALESFNANPTGYLIKPVEKEKYFEVLELTFSKVHAPEESTIAVKTKNGLRVLNVSAIVCCERVQNAVRVTLATGETITSSSIRVTFLEYVTPLLATKQFLQPHASFVLNMKCVERVMKDEFVMRGGAKVPIAKKQHTAVKQSYLDYMFKDNDISLKELKQ